MKKPLLLLLVCSFHAFSFSQNTQDNLKELFTDAEYFYLTEDYEEALFSYSAIYEHGYEGNAYINYRIGQCYLNIPGKKLNAIPFLKFAVKHMSPKITEGSFREKQAPYDAEFYLGRAFRIADKLDSAVIAFKTYKTLINPKEKLAQHLTDQEIRSCNWAAEQMRTPVYIKRVLLAQPVNTAQRDYSPAVSSDEQMLVYNSAQKFYQAIFFSRKKDGQWTTPMNITPEIQSDGNQFVSSMSFDGSILFLRQEDYYQANLLVSRYENGKWAKSFPLNRNINTKYWEGNACMSKDGKVLYFSSNRKGGLGALDLYKSVRQSNGEWGPAVSLGKTINTEFNEDAPFITEDGKKLFFISQGHQTMGGYDVFCSEIKADGSFGSPVNLGYPINTTDDDIFFVPVENGKAAYMALYSKEGHGNQDIYRVELTGKELKLPRLTENQPEMNENELSQKVAVPDTTHAVNQKQDQMEINISENGTLSEKVNIQSAPDITVSKAIFFGFNSAVLTDKAKKQLDHLATLKKNMPDLLIELVGNADSKGPDAYNLMLSEKRALYARKYLISKGVNPAHITIKGLGEKNCIAINSNPDGTDNPAGRAYNRRVEINVSGMGLSYFEEIEIPENLRVPNN